MCNANCEHSTATDDQALSTCSHCGTEAESIIGCPSGAELCQGCFDAGADSASTQEPEPTHCARCGDEADMRKCPEVPKICNSCWLDQLAE